MNRFETTNQLAKMVSEAQARLMHEASLKDGRIMGARMELEQAKFRLTYFNEREQLYPGWMFAGELSGDELACKVGKLAETIESAKGMEKLSAIGRYQQLAGLANEMYRNENGGVDVWDLSYRG